MSLRGGFGGSKPRDLKASGPRGHLAKDWLKLAALMHLFGRTIEADEVEVVVAVNTALSPGYNVVPHL